MSAPVAVQGYLDGVAYTAVIEDGTVTTSPKVFALLLNHEGTDSTDPTREPVAISTTDTMGILAGLTEHTQVISVTGDVPEEWAEGDESPNVVH